MSLQAQLAHAVEVSMVVVAVYEKLDEVRWRETNARIWCRRVVMYKEELAQIIADAYEVKASNPLVSPLLIPALTYQYGAYRGYL